MGEMLAKYEGRHFIQDNGEMDCRPLPSIMKEHFEENYSVNKINNIESFSRNKSVINIFPVDWFSPKTWDSKELRLTKNTYSIHHFSGTWLPWDVQLGIRYAHFKKKHPQLFYYFIYLPIYELKKYHIIK